MRKMMKKAIALSLIATMSMSAATIVHAEDEVTLRVLNWGNTDEEKIANDAIARFNEENPNVKVEQTCVPVESWSDFIQKWITMCTSGEAPDVISLGLEAVNMAVSNDLLVPLDDIITDDEELTAKKDQYAPSLLEGFTVNDSLYGLPNGTQTMVVYYNKHMFDEAGLEYPQDGWTWDQFRETAEKLTKDGVYGFCFPCTYFQLTPWWSTNNAALVGEDGETPTVNSEGIVEAVDFLNGMYKDGICPEPISSDGYTMFANNQVAMVGAGRWVLNTWQDAGLTNDDFDCVQWPVKEKDGSVYGGSAWCIGSTTEHQDLAIELLKEMVSDETLTAVAAGGQQVPPTEALATSTDIMRTCPDNIMGIWKAVTIADPIAAPSYFGDLEQTFLRELEEVFSGAKEPQAAMDDAQAQVQSAIQ